MSTIASQVCKLHADWIRFVNDKMDETIEAMRISSFVLFHSQAIKIYRLLLFQHELVCDPSSTHSRAPTRGSTEARCDRDTMMTSTW